MTIPEPRETGRSSAFALAVVGGGPRATYALERLSATIGRLDGRRLAIHVFELSGEFGSGQVYSVNQPHTSYLNRAAHQVSFAADPTVTGADPVRAPHERPNLHEWCRARFERTGDPAFDLGPADSPRRRQHGLALREMFDTYVAELRAVPGVTVELHPEEVVDLAPTADGRMDVVSPAGVRCTADQVLLVTGHSSNEHTGEAGPEAYLDFSQRTGAVYAPSAYPLQEHLSARMPSAESTVGCAGLGLTSMDQVLYLTEGRGGKFLPDGDRLRYEACGTEPAQVYAFSPSGMFPYTRALSRKRSPHRGRFLTKEAVDRVREASGLRVAEGERRRLDFEAHVMPLIVLEMAYVHYGTLFGPAVGELVAEGAREDYERFLAGPVGPAEDGAEVERLVTGAEAVAAGVGTALSAVLAGELTLGEADGTVPGLDARAALERWYTVVFGPPAAAAALAAAEGGRRPPVPRDSPWRLDTDPALNRFDWQTLLHPVRPRAGAEPDEFRQAYLDFLDRDLAWAEQGNLDNPHKAGVDGVWRDLRPVISHAVDGGGLSADSHRQFLDRHRRWQNKLAGGAAPEVMKKIRALIAHGALDVSAGPGATVELDEENGTYLLRGGRTSLRAPLDVLLDGKVHPFDAEHDVRPLYRRLVERKLARLWRNTTPGQETFVPGYLDLDPGSRSIGQDGRPVEGITVLGPAAAAQSTYQFRAMRPDHNDVVMREIVVWLDGFWDALHGPRARQETPPADHRPAPRAKRQP
ncbi:FAD/NAD(P)-binding protein [Kitasatospora sp. NPDC056783]|uniref:FAD/NAD(P)-binding protein n=1 Tax=Kitasatospora sp. NPDC056783 TaxID=3345943 RepID=UPI0036CA777E